MTILVTGGAGYIGSHAVRQLRDKNYKVIVIDNLAFGHVEAIIDENVIFVKGDIGDKVLLDKIFSEHKIDGVLHFAAYAYVGESVHDPLKYYQNNVGASLNLLEVMYKHKCNKLIFSSTCATYGKPMYLPIDENHPQDPINPYGASKLMLERIIKDYSNAYNLQYVFLRYFNACGASFDGKIGEDHDPETHLIPLVLQSIKNPDIPVTIFGTDYDTPDGTCIRDYIHVEDLSDAHLKALEYLLSGGKFLMCNLGVGRGYSVKEIINAANEVTQKSANVKFGQRREGDPPKLVADNKMAKTILGWEPNHVDIKSIIESAW
jgi:UDP-glucose 4-epimerase